MVGRFPDGTYERNTMEFLGVLLLGYAAGLGTGTALIHILTKGTK